MTRRRLILYVVTACLVYALALLAMLPAPWVSHAIESLSQHKLELRDPAGSGWSGSARLYARQRSGDLVDLGALRWESRPSSILAGKLAADMVLDEGRPARVEWFPGSVTVRNVQLEFPGKLLGTLAPPLEILRPEGQVRIRAENLRIDGDAVLGVADIEWRQVRLAPAKGIELGSHIAKLRGAGSRVDIELGTLDGPLRLSGRGTWSRGAGLMVSGTAEPRPEHAASIAPFLRSMCPEYRDSRCLFELKY
jgi:general secretion pathway protein N